MALDALVSESPDVQILRELVDFGQNLALRYPAYRVGIMRCITEFGETVDELIAVRQAQRERVTVMELQRLAEHLRTRLECVCHKQTESC